MPNLATVIATTARAVLTRAVHSQPAAHRSWGQAMLAELDEITNPRETASWAVGALWVVWRRQQRAWWGQAWRFATDWRAWRDGVGAPVPTPILLVVAAAFSGPIIAWGMLEPLPSGYLTGLVEAAIALNLAGRVEASLHPHPMYTRMLPRGSSSDWYGWNLLVGWRLSAVVSVVAVAVVAVGFVRFGQALPGVVLLYQGYWFLVWPQLAARTTLRRHDWRDPRAHDPLGT